MEDTAVRKVICVILWGGTGTFVLSVLAYLRPELLVLLVSVLGQYALRIGALVALGVGVIEWRKRTQLWMVPALICATFAAAVYFAAAPIGRMFGDWEFRRDLEEYRIIVDAVRSGALSCPADCSTSLIPIEAKTLPARIVRIRVGRCDGAVVVAFLVGSDVPALHEGYVFRGYAEHTSCIGDSMRIDAVWPYARHIAGDWYRFADQPGF